MKCRGSERQFVKNKDVLKILFPQKILILVSKFQIILVRKKKLYSNNGIVELIGYWGEILSKACFFLLKQSMISFHSFPVQKLIERPLNFFFLHQTYFPPWNNCPKGNRSEGEWQTLKWGINNNISVLLVLFKNIFSF